MDGKWCTMTDKNLSQYRKLCFHLSKNGCQYRHYFEFLEFAQLYAILTGNIFFQNIFINDILPPSNMHLLADCRYTTFVQTDGLAGKHIRGVFWKFNVFCSILNNARNWKNKKNTIKIFNSFTASCKSYNNIY